jgi:NTP pyrophosphatase (non-canonical NTP hydrolase)
VSSEPNEEHLPTHVNPPNQSPPESEIAVLTERLIRFRDERDWGQFHNPKDLAVALSIEASELLERYLWKAPNDADPAKVKEELADVFAYAFLLADCYGWNVTEIVTEKIARNAEKYPVAKSKGSAKKYTELGS